MDDIEQKARELLAAELDAVNRWVSAHHVRMADPTYEPAVLAIIAALSQQKATPAGFVLVPVEPTEEMLNNLYGRNLLDADDSELRGAYLELLAARPEAK